MLLELEIENFQSIRDRQKLDLRVSPNVPPQRGRLVPILPGSKIKAPLVVAFFGANGAGKSNVLRALTFVLYFVRESFQWDPDQAFPFVPFAEAMKQESPTRFSLSFSAMPSGDNGVNTVKNFFDMREFTYELDINWKPAKVLREALSYRQRGRGKSTRIFEREGEVIKAGPAFELGASYKQAAQTVLRPNASLISTLAQLNHPAALALRATASTCTSNIGTVKIENTDEQVIQYYHDERIMQSLNREVSRLDIGIRHAFITQTPNGPVMHFEHEGLNEPIPSYFESHGTRQFLRILPFVEYALLTGGIAVIDELDNSIHPLILPEIIGWFHDASRNPHGAQLWMTCQTASLLEDLTKEEIFFCEKDRIGRTTVFGLRDIQGVRRIDNFYKKYLGGVYGAVPQVG